MSLLRFLTEKYKIGVLRTFHRKKNEGCGPEMLNMTPVCRQKYARVSLLTVGRNGTVYDDFDVPSNCVCEMMRKKQFD